MRTIINGWEMGRGQLHYVTTITATPCNKQRSATQRAPSSECTSSGASLWLKSRFSC